MPNDPRARALATGNKQRARQARELVADPDHPAETFPDALRAVDVDRIAGTEAQPEPQPDQPQPQILDDSGGVGG